jgi:hypothetical protein
MLAGQNNEKTALANKASGGELIKYGGMNGKKLLYWIVGIATCGFSLFGYDQVSFAGWAKKLGQLLMRVKKGLMSGIIASHQFNDEFPAVSSHDGHKGMVLNYTLDETKR